MKVPDSEQIKECDRYTIAHEPVSSLELMERAAKACADHLGKTFSFETTFVVFCGTGNNGGDGFVIARLLYLKGYEVCVFYDAEASNFACDARTNLRKVQDISGILLLDFKAFYTHDFSVNTVIVDALFGSGLNRAVEGRVAALITDLNGMKFPKISVDIPSGLYTDRICDGPVFKADETLSFQFWKRAFLHPETGVFCGSVNVLDIGLNTNCLEGDSCTCFTADLDLAQKIYRPRQAFSHKGTHGKAAIIAGSYGKMGAAVLAAKAAVKTGSGLTFVLAPNCGYEVLQTSVPEAMFICSGENAAENFFVPEGAVSGIGPGLGTSAETEDAVLQLFEHPASPAVIDADALNILAKNKNYIEKLPPHSILTPHPKEFERLFGCFSNSFERLDKAQQISRDYKIILVLKDRFTQTVLPDGRVFYNISGNCGLAKGGSGDVLTGILTALLAQGYAPADAALFGVWLHGAAADCAVQKIVAESLTASDLIQYISSAYFQVK